MHRPDRYPIRLNRPRSKQDQGNATIRFQRCQVVWILDKINNYLPIRIVLWRKRRSGYRQQVARRLRVGLRLPAVAISEGTDWMVRYRIAGSLVLGFDPPVYLYYSSDRVIPIGNDSQPLRRKKIAEKATIRDYGAGERIVHQDAPGDFRELGSGGTDRTVKRLPDCDDPIESLIGSTITLEQGNHA